MSYRHCCVIDAENFYKTLVLVVSEPDETGKVKETIENYTLALDERLLDTGIPSGFVKPRWSGGAWEEGATPEEIREWEEQTPPVPDPGQTQEQRLSSLEQQVTDMQMAVVESYEAADGQAAAIMLAQAEAYETAEKQKGQSFFLCGEGQETLPRN